MDVISRRRALQQAAQWGAATVAVGTGASAWGQVPGQGAAMPAPSARWNTVDWAKHHAIYELNVRQHTADGTLRAAEADLPRLRSLGIDIVWLMPIQPIGQLKRKGILGSYYAVQHYTEVNPEFGTLEDAKRFVRAARELGMKVILDWVANHTAWDHAWIAAHPDWYRRNSAGDILPVKANPDDPADAEIWEDVAWLDYSRPELGVAMIEAMRFWRTEVGVDGFRCDVAGFVPLRFWELTRKVLERDGPLILLAEGDKPEMHTAAFDITYDWKLQQVFQRIAQGQADATQLLDWWVQRVKRFPPGSIGLNFLTNHDINSWHGSDAELYGSPEAAQAMAVLMATLPGIPLLYSGQESFSRKRLAFFERDAVDWGLRPLEAFYTRLLKARSTTPALQASLTLDGLEWLPDTNTKVITYQRLGATGRRVQVSVNLSPEPQTAIGRFKLPPWGWVMTGPTTSAAVPAGRPNTPNRKPAPSRAAPARPAPNRKPVAKPAPKPSKPAPKPAPKPSR